MERLPSEILVQILIDTMSDPDSLGDFVRLSSVSRSTFMLAQHDNEISRNFVQHIRLLAARLIYFLQPFNLRQNVPFSNWRGLCEALVKTSTPWSDSLAEAQAIRRTQTLLQQISYAVRSISARKKVNQTAGRHPTTTTLALAFTQWRLYKLGQSYASLRKIAWVSEMFKQSMKWRAKLEPQMVEAMMRTAEDVLPCALWLEGGVYWKRAERMLYERSLEEVWRFAVGREWSVLLDDASEKIVEKDMDEILKTAGGWGL